MISTCTYAHEKVISILRELLRQRGCDANEVRSYLADAQLCVSCYREWSSCLCDASRQRSRHRLAIDVLRKMLTNFKQDDIDKELEFRGVCHKCYCSGCECKKTVKPEPKRGKATTIDDVVEAAGIKLPFQMGHIPGNCQLEVCKTCTELSFAERFPRLQYYIDSYRFMEERKKQKELQRHRPGCTGRCEVNGNPCVSTLADVYEGAIEIVESQKRKELESAEAEIEAKKQKIERDEAIDRLTLSDFSII